MSTVEWRDMGLVELAYPYAMDAVTDKERDAIERRRDRADRLTVAAFDETVDTVRETMAELVIVDSCPAPAKVEAGLMRSLVRPQSSLHSATARWSCGSDRTTC